MKLSNVFFLLLLISTLFFQACDDDGSKDPDPCSANFDQAAMFENIADNIIVPAFQDFQAQTDALADAITDFTNTPNDMTLGIAQITFSSTYEFWQEVAPFNFGPAEAVFLRSSVNNFPLNVQALTSNITSGTYDFDQPDRFDKGLPAMDYLLFGLGDDNAAIIDFYTNNADAASYKTYLNAVVADIKERIDATTKAWNETYRATFISNTGTAAGTSLSLLINHLNENYELIKREKLGIPSGVVTLGFPNPDKVEAFYSQKSAQLASIALRATKELYTGLTGLGLDDYLETVNAEKDGIALDQLIQEKLDNAIDAVNALNDPLSTTIEDDQTSVEAAYNEVTKVLVNLKTDMPSVLCVSITYIDNPSDSD